MRIDQVVNFEQTDEAEYTLTVCGDDESDWTRIRMDNMEAIRLYNLVVKTMVGYVTDMNIAKASYERGEGPNGEPRGTWEAAYHREDPWETLRAPQSLDAYRCTDPEGDWILEMADQLNKQRKENRG